MGTNDEIRKLIGADTAVFDARGKTITPGFTDAHLHPYPVYPPSSPLAKVDLRPVAVNSDSPVSAADPLLRIQSMVTRKTAEGKVYGPQQSVSAESAIRIWTLGSASASFEGDIKGSIEPRKHADFVVLARDPTQVPPEAIKDIPVERTYVGGKLAFSRKYLAK